MLADRSPLFFHDLAFHADGDEVAVGRPETGSFAIFPADGAELLRRLIEGNSPATAAIWYQSTYGEAVNMGQFLATLHELGLLRTPASLTRTPSPARPGPSPAGPQPAVRWQRLGRAVFSVPAQLVWLGVVVTAVVTCVRNPQLVPARHDVFFVPSLLAIELTILVAQVPLTLAHELAHVLAGRRIGVWSRLRIAHRFTVVVFETVLDGLVVVPRSKRYLPLAAGMLTDLVVIAGLVDAAWLLRSWQHRVSLAALICLALAYTTIPRIAWQFFVFLRTDVYFLLQTALRGDDIDAAARDQLRAWWSRRLRRPAPAAPLRPASDVRAGRIFAPLLVGGYACVAVTTAVIVAPLMGRFIQLAIREARDGGPLRWDAAAVLLLNLAEPVAARLLARRDRRRPRKELPPPRPVPLTREPS
jgi:hypothetical protein